MLLSSKEMLEQWRLRHCLDASGMTGMTYETTFDAEDNDLIESARMRDWYADLLSRGDPSLTPATDIAADVPVVAGTVKGEWLITVPENVVAVTTIETETRVPVMIVASNSAQARLLSGPFAPIPTDRPTAVVNGSDVVRLYLDSGDEPPRIGRMMAVTRPPEGFYSLTDKGLAMIPPPELYL